MDDVRGHHKGGRGVSWTVCHVKVMFSSQNDERLFCLPLPHPQPVTHTPTHLCLGVPATETSEHLEYIGQ